MCLGVVAGGERKVPRGLLKGVVGKGSTDLAALLPTWVVIPGLMEEL